MPLILLLVAACGGGSTGGDDSTAPATEPPVSGLGAFGDVIWQLVTATVDGEPLQLIDGHPVTVSLTDDGVGGTAACNSYFGQVSATGDMLTVGELASTMMACVGDDVMQLETAFLTALPRVTAARIADGNLLLTGEGVEMTFVAQVPAPDAELEGTRWVLDALIDTDTVSSTVAGSNATLTISEGSLSGSTGCNSMSGPVEIVDGRLAAGGIATTKMACDEGRMSQEAHVLAVLGANPSITIEGETLTLSADDGRGLVYRVG